MLSFVVYSVLAVGTVLILAALLPVRLYLSAAGGSDRTNGILSFDCRVLFFGGLLGGGVRTAGSDIRVTVLVRDKGLLFFSISGLLSFAERKVHERRLKKTAKEKVKKPSTAKKRKPLKVYLSMAKTGLGVVRWMLSEFSGCVGFDRFSVHVTLGLGRPDITGWISGLLIGLNGILPERYEIVPSWDFTREIIRGEGALSISFRGYVFLARLITRVPITAYRKRKEIVYWFTTLRDDTSKQSFQEV